MRWIVLVLLLAAPASAQTARIIVSEPRGEDRIHLVAEFPDRSQMDLDLPLAVATPDGIRDTINARRLRTPAHILVPVGRIIDLTPPPPPPQPPPEPAPTTQDIWLEQARRLMRVKALGLTAAGALAEIAALEDEVNRTYEPGYVSAF